jgi:hypothetical protein
LPSTSSVSSTIVREAMPAGSGVTDRPVNSTRSATDPRAVAVLGAGVVHGDRDVVGKLQALFARKREPTSPWLVATRRWGALTTRPPGEAPDSGDDRRAG